jgi:uncharacterized membrane protein YeaQ/YmgE (transglycosylase-associated protein family)
MTHLKNSKLYMNEKLTKTIAVIGLFTGCIFGIIGSFVSSASFRGLAWEWMVLALILASALLTVYNFRNRYRHPCCRFSHLCHRRRLILSCNAAD